MGLKTLKFKVIFFINSIWIIQMIDEIKNHVSIKREINKFNVMVQLEFR